MKLNFLTLLLIVLFPISVFSQVGICTDNPNPLNIDQANLDVNGRVIIRNLEKYDPTDTAIEPIGVDKNGVLLKIENTPTDVAFFQSSNSNKYAGTELDTFNSGGEYVVYWTPSTDQIFNDLLEFNKDDNSFSFIEDGKYEVNGFINFGTVMASSYVNEVGNYLMVNATIQYLLKDNQSAGWQDLSTCTSIFTGGILAKEYRSETMSIPAVLFPFSAGDKLRVIVKKPEGISVGGFEISKPTGSLYSKSLRVVVP